jgi:hypothetical protein
VWLTIAAAVRGRREAMVDAASVARCVCASNKVFRRETSWKTLFEREKRREDRVGGVDGYDAGK